MSIKSIKREVSIQGRLITFELNKYAKQANGSVFISSGGTQLLVTVCADKEAKENIDFFPLGVDYIEKSYAVGRIPGGYIKREGKPSDLAALTARVIDRPLRPCFPKNYRNETVVTVTVLSYEHGYSPAPLALLGASTALMISDIPFNGPVAGLRIGQENGQFVVDPLEGKDLELDLIVACKQDAILMVEAGANFFSEDQMIEAISFGQESMQPLLDIQRELQKEFGKEKMSLTIREIDSELTDTVKEILASQLPHAYSLKKLEKGKALKELEDQIIEKLSEKFSKDEINKAIEKSKARFLRTNLTQKGIRIDGRKPKEIRPISCEVGILNKAHGSALFTRGETQSLAVITLASSEDQQRSETLWDLDMRERFMLHYNFPPFCVGEARMQKSPGRREIGHGNLAQRALARVIPPLKDFGYTIRAVAETLESNGSSSMASVCSGTMGMLNAGIPLIAPVSGIAMGLIKEDDQYVILSDIQGDEDHLGDMDFKVCGTAEGITALQMDIKIDGITKEIMKEALEQAKEGRQYILEKMIATISEPAKLNDLAPRIFKVKIKQEKIKDLIGPGGKTIKKATSETGARIDIEDSGIINIIAPDALSAQAAKSFIRLATTTPQVGDVVLGKAIRIMDFGVFIEIKPGVEGLCHISQLDEKRVETISDVVKVGEDVLVKIVDVDKQGRIKLSRKDALNEKPTHS